MLEYYVKNWSFRRAFNAALLQEILESIKTHAVSKIERWSPEGVFTRYNFEDGSFCHVHSLMPDYLPDGQTRSRFVKIGYITLFDSRVKILGVLCNNGEL